MKMIEDLAIYENMLEQCEMKERFLIEDYENAPLAESVSMRQGKTYVSSIAWHGGKPVGYTVSIGT